MSAHEQFAEDLALHALGALQGEERTALEKHLDTCSACRLELDQLRGDMALMATAKDKRPTPIRKTVGARGDLPPATDLKRTVVIENVAPTVDAGRYPLKREVGADTGADVEDPSAFAEPARLRDGRPCRRGRRRCRRIGGDDVHRSALHLFENTNEVHAENSRGDELHTREKRQRHEHRGPPFRRSPGDEAPKRDREAEHACSSLHRQACRFTSLRCFANRFVKPSY